MMVVCKLPYSVSYCFSNRGGWFYSINTTAATFLIAGALNAQQLRVHIAQFTLHRAILIKTSTV